MATADLRRRLLRLDAQILKQKLLLNKLEQNREDVERELHATATFPISPLPVETIQEIFLQCGGSPRVSDLGHHMQGTTSQIPLVLSSVCRRWREVALSTPTLWSTLHFNFDSMYSEPDAGAIEEYIHRWLDRAAARPLSLHFRLRGSQGDDDWIVDGFTPRHLHHLLQKYSDTIHFLEVDMSQNGIRQVGLDSLPFPVLKSAMVGTPWSGRGPHVDPQNPVHVFGNAPLLHEQVFHGPSFYYVFPWSQLTKFDGEITTMDLFRLAPNVTEARCSVPSLDPTPTSTITHPRLRSLALIESVLKTKSIDILEYLTLPSLQSLHISDMEDTSYDTLDVFLERSSPPLLTLSVRVDDADFFDWVECLTCVGPTLENLELESPPEEVQLRLFNYRNKPEHSIPHLPNLRALTLLNASQTNYAALVHFLYRTPKLCSFRLFCSPGGFLDDKIMAGPHARKVHDSLRDHLAKLAERGKNINISTDTHNYVELVGCVHSAALAVRMVTDSFPGHRCYRVNPFLYAVQVPSLGRNLKSLLVIISSHK
ncbi:hypothetical protein DFH07DRAFT_804870 [Mycena maculata]|uniref:F-box domain-containing protein n=1 Tax=Mycena maculata TaxID=230809 RepID=A0AAD7JV31_9AGAR|nr:hypothetical protein DFH07DRAFT_804870 [Mycena maculata]